MNQQKQTQLILALDCEDRKLALELLEPLQGDLKWVKIGLQLFSSLQKLLKTFMNGVFQALM